MIPRRIYRYFEDPELNQQMLFVAGPRQVGKTTLAKYWLNQSIQSEKAEQLDQAGLYLNWDSAKLRKQFQKDPNFFESEAREKGSSKGSLLRIVLDEIHKMPKWKTLVKGYFDEFNRDFRFLVTGSARLDMFRKSGDSLLGRYHLLHLNPIFLPEIVNLKEVELACTMESYLWEDLENYLSVNKASADSVESLIQYSGFPGIYTKQSKRALSLWHREYSQRMIYEDLRDLSKISDLMKVETLFELLPSRIASPLSYNSLREDLGVSHEHVKTMINALRLLYSLYIIRPYSNKIKYALKKEPKLYFYDWTLCQDEGSLFENFIATQLKTYCDFVNDGAWSNLELSYIRDKQKREVDFVIVQDKKPVLLIETKSSEAREYSAIDYYRKKIKIPAVIVVRKSGVYKKIDDDFWMVSAERFLANLFI